MLVICVAATAEHRRHESRFITELKLVLDGFVILRVKAIRPGFASLSMGQQIEHIRSLVAAHGAAAAMWIVSMSNDVLLLHLVAVSTGRALVRLIERRKVKGSEADLALSAKELLGTAYMFQSSRFPPPPGVQRVVEAVRKMAGVSAPARRVRPWAVAVDFRASGGVVGHSGPSVGAGAVMGMERTLFKSLHIGLFMGAAARPLESAPGLDSSGFELSTRLQAFYGFRFAADRFLVGPLAAVGAQWTSLSLKSGQGPEARYSWWNGSGAVGVGVRIRLGRALSLNCHVAAEALLHRYDVRRRSNGHSLFVSPYLRWTAALGVAFPL